MKEATSALAKGLKVIDYVADNQSGVNLKQIAEFLGCSSPAAKKICDTLLEYRYIKKIQKPQRFVAGNKLRELSTGQAHLVISEQITECMLRIQKRIPEVSVHYCEYIGSEVAVTRYIRSQGPGIICHVQPDVLLPYTSVATIVHLAFWPDLTSVSYSKTHMFDEYGSGLWKEEELMRQAIAETRNKGYYLFPFNRDLALRVGVPVFGKNNDFLGSLTIHCVPELMPENIEERLIEIADICIFELEELKN